MQSQRAAPPATCWLLFRLDAHGREQKKKKEKKIRTSNLNEKNSISIQATRRENVIPATNRSAGLFQFVGLFVATTVTQEALTEFFFYLKYILKFFHWRTCLDTRFTGFKRLALDSSRLYRVSTGFTRGGTARDRTSFPHVHWFVCKNDVCFGQWAIGKSGRPWQCRHVTTELFWWILTFKGLE